MLTDESVDRGFESELGEGFLAGGEEVGFRKKEARLGAA